MLRQQLLGERGREPRRHGRRPDPRAERGPARSSTAAVASRPMSSSIRVTTSPDGRTAQPPTMRPSAQIVGPALPAVSNRAARCGPRYQSRPVQPIVVGSSGGSSATQGSGPAVGSSVVGQDVRRLRRPRGRPSTRRRPRAPRASRAPSSRSTSGRRPPFRDRTARASAGPARPGRRPRGAGPAARQASAPSATTGTGSSATCRAAGPGRAGPRRPGSAGPGSPWTPRLRSAGRG